MSLCECGCGGHASPGSRFIRGHNMRVNHSTKGKKLTDEVKQKERETKRLNKLLKEGKIKLPFCACGCGKRVTKLGNRYIYGHNKRGKHHSKETKEKIGKAITGENNGMYGKDPWNKGETKETNESIRIASEKVSISNKKTFRKPEYREKYRKLRKNQKFLRHHTQPELRCEDFSIKNTIPVTYTGSSSFWIPKRNNGTKVYNPDFILYANGKKFVIEVLGDYWHSALLNKKVLDDDFKNKKKHYKKYGWIPVFIWESDIMRPDGEKFFLSELKKAGAI